MIDKKISVLMSVYNNQDSLERAVSGILNQTHNNIELLIMDDCSTDNSRNILDSFSEEKNVKIFKNTSNLGLTKSLNLLLKEATGTYIARQDADDFSLSKRFEIQLKLMAKKNYSISTTMAYKNEKRVINLIPKFRHFVPSSMYININNPFIHGTLMIEKYIIDQIGGYDERFIYSQDYKLFYDLIKNNQKILKVTRPLYVLNTKNNISSLKSKEQSYFADCVKNGKNP